MPKKSVKANKTIYQITREELGLTREGASEQLTGISAETIERIESGKRLIRPEDVLEMSEKYNRPNLCNYYCSHDCPIGQKYVPEVKIKDLSQIVLEMISALNRVQENKNRLIDITLDGEIDDSELEDFVKIQDELEKISVTVETLQLWAEKMIADGAIDKEKYEKLKK
ncbi:MAG: helix-turn-helix transcriptional regulator [Ruminococcus sp.]|nr:helix-turn-helix transcriptional regulator [Ruminococcus sp.]